MLTATRPIEGAAPGRIMLVLFTGVFMSALDVAIVAPALPLLRSAFAVDNRQIGLFVLVYALCALVSAAPMASLSDRYGRRIVYLLCVASFAAGSLLVALAPTLPVALVGRAVQGLSAGGITPAASAVVGDTFPVEQRGKALGMLGATFGMAFLIGPLLASLLLLVVSWHWLFLLNLPVALLIIARGLRVLPGARAEGEQPPFDLGGTVVLFSLLASLTLGINGVVDDLTGVALRPWLLLLAALCLPLLLWVEVRAPRPIVPLSIFSTRQVRLAYLLTLGAGFGMGSVIYITSLAVAAFAFPERQAGFLLLPMVIASTSGSMLFGRWLNALGSRTVMLIGFGVLVAGAAQLGLFGASFWLFLLATSLVGLGVGIVVGGTLRFIVLNEVPARQRAVAQGLINVGTNIGNLVAVAALGVVADSQGGGVPGYGLAYLVTACVALAMLAPTLALKTHAAEREAILEQTALAAER